MSDKNSVNNKDERIVKNDESGFEVHFKFLKLGAFVTGFMTAGVIVIDNVLYLGGILGSLSNIAFKILILYGLYLTAYILFSDYIIKLTPVQLLKYSAPIPKLWGNKSISRDDIEDYYIHELKTKSRVNNTTIRQTYYNLKIKTRTSGEFTFFYSLSRDEVYLVKRLLDEHLSQKTA